MSLCLSTLVCIFVILCVCDVVLVPDQVCFGSEYCNPSGSDLTRAPSSGLGQQAQG